MTGAVRASAVAITAGLVLLGSVGTNQVMAADLRFGATIGAATGTFGLSEQTSLAVLEPFLTTANQRLRFTAYFPVLYRTTPFVTTSGSMHFGSDDGRWDDEMDDWSHHGHHGDDHVPDPSSISFDRTGLGDPRLRVDLTPARSVWPHGLGAFLVVKPPVADLQEGFSTGGWDLGAGLTFARHVASVDVATEVGYWRLGDGPYITLQDAVTVDIEVAPSSAADWPVTVAASVRAVSTTVPGRGPLVEIGVVLSRGRWPSGVAVAVRAGATSAAPDISLSLSVPLGRQRPR